MSASTSASGSASDVAGFFSRHRKAVVSGVVAAAVLVVAGVAVAVSSGGSSSAKHAGGSDATPTTVAVHVATTVPLAPASLAGTYDATRVVTVGNSSLPAGTTEKFSFSLACTGSPCQLTSTSLRGLTTTADGFRAQWAETETCPGANNSGTYLEHVAYDMHADASAATSAGQSLPSRLTGTDQLTVSDFKCTRGIIQPVTQRVTAVRRA